VEGESAAGPSADDGPIQSKPTPADDDDDDKNIRFTVGAGGRRMSKADFISAISRLDPKTRQRMLDESDAPEAIKREASTAAMSESSSTRGKKSRPEVQRVPTAQDRPTGPEGLALVDSNNEDIPFHPVSDTLAKFNLGGSSGETAAQRRRRQAQEKTIEEDDDEEDRGSPRGRPRGNTNTSVSPAGRPATRGAGQSYLDEGETAAERKRRLAALTGGGDDDSSSEEEGEGGRGLRDLLHSRSAGAQASKKPEQGHERGPSIRFADPAPKQGTSSAVEPPAEQSSSQSGPSKMSRLRWGANVGKKPGDGSKK